MSSGVSPGSGAGQKEEAETFEVTWEHEDGSIDKGVGVRLINKMYPAPGRWRSGSLISDGRDIVDASEGWGVLHPLPPAPAAGPLDRLRSAVGSFFGGAKMDRARLATLGANALLAYGFVSNISYTACLIAAWVVFGKRTGLSPLTPGQWPGYLAVYAGFWAVQNLIRPARFALSVALTPVFDALVAWIQAKASAVTRRSVNKAAALAVTVFLVNVCGTFSLLFGGLFVATRIAGVPLLP